MKALADATCYVNTETGQATLVTYDYYAFLDCKNFNDYIGDCEIPIYTWNKHYTSPYEIPAETPDDFLRDLMGEKDFDKLEREHIGDDFSVIERSALDNGYYIAPITLHDHSGLTYKAGIYYGWDDSYCGFACVAKAEFDTWLKRDTTVEDFKRNLENELEYLNAYANGLGFFVEVYDLETQEQIKYQNNLAFVEDLAPSVSDPEKAIVLEDCPDIERAVEMLIEQGILPEPQAPEPELDTHEQLYEQLKSEYPKTFEELQSVDERFRKHYLDLVEACVRLARNSDSLEAQTNKLEQDVGRVSCSLDSLAQDAKTASQALSKNDSKIEVKERDL